jgi:PhzF family phenazine biosynthesis protein
MVQNIRYGLWYYWYMIDWATEIYAFSKNGVGGNRAGVVLDASALSTDQMQSIATKVGASESAFVIPGKNASYRIRFFTPTTEVSMCGHASVAAWFLMSQNGNIAPGQYSQTTKSGSVAIKVTDNGHVFMAMNDFYERDEVRPTELAICLGLSVVDIDTSFAPQIITKDLIIKLRSLRALQSIKPNLPLMLDMSTEKDFYAFHVFCEESGQEYFCNVRSFAPRVGIKEDAATGTGNACMLYLLAKRNILPTTTTVHTIRQGGQVVQPSYIHGRVDGAVVWIGGEATLAQAK